MMFNMHSFSSSTRNQHPNHGLVPGTEKRRRKKKAPATSTSSSTDQVSPLSLPTPLTISSVCLAHLTSPLSVPGPVLRAQCYMTLSPATKLLLIKTLLVILVIPRIPVLNRPVNLRVLRALQVGHRLVLFLVRIVGLIRGGKLPGVTWIC